MRCSKVLLVLLLAALPAAAEQASAKKPNKLVAGKLVYVAPMPGSLDQWILDNLRRWGKYRVTGDPEGVDLVVEVNAPERETQYDMRGGIPRPRRDDGKSPRPGREPAEPGAISVTVTDWVTRETLWHADLLNRKQKKDEADPPAGPHAKIFARGLTPDQLALKITTQLHEYVSELEKARQAPPRPGTIKEGSIAIMKVAITGAAGLFGRGLVEAFSTRHAVFALTRADADITRADQVEAVLRKLEPEIVIHPAGIPDLDICEADPAKAYLVNVLGTRNVVEVACKLGAAIAFISTDAVFDGQKRAPYVETDPACPPTVYGRTKLRAERLVAANRHHWIFRVSVLFGRGKTNFVEKGLRKIAAGEQYQVAADQLGSATYTTDAARKILEVVEAGRYGLYHLSNQGACSRHELARRAAELAGLDAGKVVGVPSEELGRRAARLKYAVMAMQALEGAGFAPPRPWQEALAEYVRAIQPALGARSAATVHR